MKFFFQKRSNGKVEHNGSAVMEAEMETAVVAGNAENEIAAVITMAIHMHIMQMRECEKTSMTIQKAIKPYSPWSSKIYGLRQQPMFIPGLKSRLK